VSVRPSGNGMIERLTDRKDGIAKIARVGLARVLAFV